MANSFCNGADACSNADEIIDEYPEKTGRLLNVLNRMQDEYRYVSEDSIRIVSKRLGVPQERIRSMAEFFSYLSLDPVGKHVVEICDGTACHALGAPRLVGEFERLLGIEVGDTTEDGLVTLRTVNCVGACSVAPVVVASGEAYGRVKVTAAASIVDDIEPGGFR